MRLQPRPERRQKSFAMSESGSAEAWLAEKKRLRGIERERGLANERVCVRESEIECVCERERLRVTQNGCVGEKD